MVEREAKTECLGRLVFYKNWQIRVIKRAKPFLDKDASFRNRICLNKHRLLGAHFTLCLAVLGYTWLTMIALYGGHLPITGLPLGYKQARHGCTTHTACYIHRWKRLDHICGINTIPYIAGY